MTMTEYRREIFQWAPLSSNVDAEATAITQKIQNDENLTTEEKNQLITELMTKRISFR